ncbi:MAG: carboxypeptidase-like regulatory domain-containing protein [Bacteroidetes bacterium]|nr:carboxypeptidase-like regulatory domain-containing protein [Bacteroidota bacterium]
MKRIATVVMRTALLLGLLLQALPDRAYAQAGKVAGTVTDAETGETLPGASVIIDGTTIGTTADSQGRYTLIGITPGVYSIRASFVGYTPLVYDNIRVTSDRTTSLDFAITSEVVQAGEIVVTAIKPVVDQNQTISRSLVSSDEIGALPVSSLEDVIAKTANAYNGFVRGSRRFETKTVVEGIDVSDAFYSLSEGDNYFGSTYSNFNKSDQTSASILTINPDAVEEVTVNSGAPGAEYAGSSGGVVAVTLSEGRGPIRGSFSVRATPYVSEPGPDSLDIYLDQEAYMAERQAAIDANAADPDPLATAKINQLYTWTPDKYTMGGKPEFDVRANVGGSLTDRISFGLSGQFFQTYGWLPNYFRRRINGQLKTTIDVSDRTKLTAVGIIDDKGRWGGWNDTDYMDFFKWSLESVAQHDAGSYVGSLRLTQIISDKSYVYLQAYRTDSQTRYGYVDDNGNGFQEVGENGDFINFLDPVQSRKYIAQFDTHDYAGDPKMFIEDETDTFFEANIRSPDGNKYNLGRPTPFSEDQRSELNGLKVHYVNQVNANNYVQAGAEVKLRKFTYTGVAGQPPGSNLQPDPEPFRVSQWERNPVELGFYASDRVEYAGLKVNAGIRVDVVDRNVSQIVDYYYPFVRDSVQIGGEYRLRNNFNRGDKAPLDVLWNPSIGISHPIGSTASMYFAYSHSEQMVPYNEIYRNYDGNHSRNQFVQLNDPMQDPIISNNFELGIQWEFTTDWGLDINAYGRSIANYGVTVMSATNNTPAGGTVFAGMTTYSYRTDFGYADSRGIEAVIRRRPAKISDDISLGLTASYTYSTVEQAITTGSNTNTFSLAQAISECVANGGTAETCRAQQDLQLPFDNTSDFQNFAQSVRGGSPISGGYDRRHRVLVRATSTFPYDIDAGLLASVESGFLYPPAVDIDPRDRALLTGPTNYTIDLRIGKEVRFADRYGAEIFVDIKNLTNRQNVIAYDNNALTGADVIFQQTGVPGKTLVDVDGFSYYGPARTIYLGIKGRF